mgnify:FL=1
MTVAGGGTTGIITVHRTLTSFKPCAETPDQYHRRYPCDQQEGRKVFESADSCHRSSFSIAGRWNCVSSCLDPTRTADLRAVSPLLAAATHIPAVASPTDAPKIKPACRSVNYVAVPWCWNAIRQPFCPQESVQLTIAVSRSGPPHKPTSPWVQSERPQGLTFGGSAGFPRANPRDNENRPTHVMRNRVDGPRSVADMRQH